MRHRIGTRLTGPAYDIEPAWPYGSDLRVDLTAVGALQAQLAECNREQWKTVAEMSREFREIAGL